MSNKTDLIKRIVDASAIYTSARTRYITLAQELKSAGCTVKDVVPFLKKVARREEYYSQESEFETAVKLGKDWAKSIQLFGVWVKRNLNNKWEIKRSESADIKAEEERIKEEERKASLSPDELEEEKEKEKKEKELKQEVQVAQFITKNSAAFKRLAEKEGITTPADTIITTLKTAIEAGRIG